MPTWDAKHYVEHHGNDRPFITVAKNGQLAPESRAVIATMLRENGFNDADLTLMFRANPAKILGLPLAG
jgi:hypothetical protein